MDVQEAEKFLADETSDAIPDFMATPPPSAPVLDAPYSLTPQTDQIVSDIATPPAPSIAGRTGPKSFLRQQEEQFRRDYSAPGISLDTETGLPAWDRLMLSARTSPQNQISYLESKYGPNTVRQSPKGLIVRVPDPKNPSQSRDILADEESITGKDFIDMLGSVPEIAATLFTRRLGSKLPFLAGKEGFVGVARDVATSTALAETTGAAKDIAANVYDRQVIDLPEVAKERAKMAGVDVAFGAVSYPAARFFQWLKNPAAGYRGEVQFDAIAAQKFFKEKYGVDIPLSIGESTGAPLFGRTETFIEKMPGGSGPIRELKATQEEGFRKLQNILIGAGPESDEVFGQKSVDAIRSKIEPVSAKAASLSARLSAASQSNIEGIISGVTLPERELYKSSLGADIRQKIIGLRNAAKEQSDILYEKVKSLPGGEGKVFDGSGLQEDFAKIKSALPTPSSTVEKPTALLDQFGNEIKQTSKEVKTLREFVPPNVLSRLESVIGLKDATFSLSDLQQMRREVYDDISKGEGVPGLGTHYLADIGKALTKAIDTGVSSLPTGELKTALAQANEFYKKQLIPFNRIGLTEMFRTADEAGHIGDSEIISRILGGTRSLDNWNLMKETLGSNSVEFNRLRRTVADNLIENSRLPGESVIDAKSFISNLADFRKNQREISNDVFGATKAKVIGKDEPIPSTLGELFRQARFLKYAEGDKLDAGELQKLLANPSANADMLKQLILTQRKQDDLFKNSILKAIGSGKLDESTLKPSEFVNRMLQSAEPSEVKQVVGLINDNPDLVQELRQKTFEKIFRDAARSATTGDINLIMSGEKSHILSGTKIAESLKNATYAEKIKSILGTEGFNDLEQYVKLQAAPEGKETAFKLAGGMAAGAQIANLERRGPIAFLSDSARNFIFSTILSRPPLRTWLTSVPDQPGKLSLLLASPPFLEAVTKEFGQGTGAEAFMHHVKSAVDRSFTSTPPARPKPFVPSWKSNEDYWRKQLDDMK